MDNWQKIKMLKLVDLLRNESDEQHPLTTNCICEHMETMGIPCDRRTLSRDIALLNDTGVEVLEVRVGKSKGYYVDDRNFSVPELKILIDAVQAASFITEKKTAALIGKIAELGGSHKAEILKKNLVNFNTRKHCNESIYYNVDALEDAIQQQKKIIFRYFDLDINGQKAYRRDGHHYVVEPMALVYNEDNYYAITYSSRYDKTSNYRVDRMDAVEVIDEPISAQAVELRSHISDYTGQVFKMYGGPSHVVVLEFNTELIGAVYDRFGEKTIMMPVSDNKVRATIKVQIAPTFWGWIFQFGKQMRIVSPDEVVEEYRARAAELLS